ncbi:DNA/RNA non-specific endonuclease [Microbacterium sp. cx-55]|uniref:DNA/RNA non-specific endonuclease n=1 Tax=Microbacterium sp. cx-55 TaxID=2875948 RepID=UPI001CBBB515|nr:DNA/RNA non-specific endonuclease [Microbacterium sp. cx-55]MBZ4488097.1 DNA/RNA non-specific endonuclease [Microbacterium sp. cx-55]UGB34494.1 DNA/RNA non-specific endonuclease [Microbacterium sp. cx-55]
MSTNSLIASPAASEPSAFGGAYLLQDGADLANAIQSGNWVEGGVAAFTTALDTVGMVIDPIGTLIANGLGWVLDHIEPLRGWLQDLSGNASEVQAFGQTWANAAGRLEQVGADLHHRLGDLDGLSGQTVDAYSAHVRDLASNLSATGQWAGAVGSGLQIASTLVQAVYELVRDAISQVVGTAISAAITTAATLGVGSPIAIGQVVTKVSALATRIGSFVTKLLRSLREFLPLIDRLAGAVEKVLARFHTRLPGGSTSPQAISERAPLSSNRLDSTGPEGWRPLSREDIDDLPVVRDGTHMSPEGRLQPDTWYQTGEHDYIYHTDSNGYIDRFHAENLELKTHEGRLSHDPDTPGKLDGDHAGHLAADQFGGSPKLDNLVSQLSHINLSDYKKLETDWANALKADPPGVVSVDVRITTDPTGRPTAFIVESTINGHMVPQTFRQ